MLAVLPSRAAVELHELTSQWLNGKGAVGSGDIKHRVLTTELPKIDSRAAWILHNLVAHVAIGLVPTEATFRFHDWSAEYMAVPGWV